MRWLGLGGQTVNSLRRLACKFDLDQSERKSSQVNASARKPWPNEVASWPKSSICVNLRLRLTRALRQPSRPRALLVPSTVPVLSCRDYQRSTCSFQQDHYGLLRGERKWLRHICADCWVNRHTQALHSEGSKECPSSANPGAKTNFLEHLRSPCRFSWWSWRCFLKWLFRFRGFWSWHFRYETWTISWQCKTSYLNQLPDIFSSLVISGSW